MNRVAIIMAGGVGERFWPLSRRDFPKQLVHIGERGSMLDAAIERVSPLVGIENVFVVTSLNLRSAILNDTKSIRPENVLSEPEPRNTAVCLTFATAIIQSRYEGEVVAVVVAADHHIPNEDAFRSDCLHAIRFAEENDALITFGIRPRRPETGYGYVEVGNSASRHAPIFRVSTFREKPDLETARMFLADGGFLWNSGMFVWRLSVLAQGLADQLPAIHAKIDLMQKAKDDPDELAKIYSTTEKISIDVGLLERAENVYVVRASFEWDDIGAWTAMRRLLGKDTAGNTVLGNGALVKCEDCIVYNTPSGDGHQRLIVGYNLQNMIIVSTSDAVMILPAEDDQQVKDIVTYIRKKGLDEYL